MNVRLKAITRAGKEFVADLKWFMLLPRAGETLCATGGEVPVPIRDMRLTVEGVAWHYNGETFEATPTIIAVEKAY